MFHYMRNILKRIIAGSEENYLLKNLSKQSRDVNYKAMLKEKTKLYVKNWRENLYLQEKGWFYNSFIKDSKIKCFFAPKLIFKNQILIVQNFILKRRARINALEKTHRLKNLNVAFYYKPCTTTGLQLLDAEFFSN